MKNRITMNSESLQKHFPEVYRDFFSKCPIVVSIPGFFTWAGDYFGSYGAITVFQHLPLRIYIGLNPKTNQKPISSFYNTFNPILKGFESHNLNEVLPKKELYNFLSKWIDKHGENQSGFEIHILSELPFGTARGFHTAVSGGISATLLLANKILKSKDINELANQRLDDWFDSHPKPFDKLLQLQIEIFRFIADEIPVSAYYFPAAFVNSSYPVACFSQTSLSLPNSNLFTPFIQNYDLNQKRLQYCCFRLNEIFKLPTSFPFVIDFGFLTHGTPYLTDTETIFRLKDDEDLSADIKKIIKNLRPHLNMSFIKNSLYHDLIKDCSYHYGVQLTKLASIVELKTLTALENVYRGGDIAQLISLLDTKNYLFRLFAPTTQFSDKFDEARIILTKMIKNQYSSAIGIKYVPALAEFAFVAPSRYIRTDFLQLIDEFQSKINIKLNLGYASWLDGFEEEGIKVEQHLAEGIRSKFISEGTVTLRKWTAAESPTTELSTLEKLEKEQKNIDLLINIPEEKIYVRGEKLTSRELKSTSATIDILKILLENISKSISCKNLPESSYSQDRNEMQSKIISPLTKIIKQKTRQKLPLKVTGGLTEFYLKLEPSEMDIRIIEKIF